MANPAPVPPAWPNAARTPDFVIPASNSHVTINFVTNVVTVNRERKKWPLSNITKIVGNTNLVEVKTDKNTPVEVIPGPAVFSFLPPVLVPGKKYVILEGTKNGWKLRHNWGSRRQGP